MLTITKYKLVFLFIIGSIGSLFCQELNIDFYYYGADNKKVNALGQLEIAKDGRVWIGTWGQGLFVFDGYQFKHFMHNPENPIDLKSNYIVGLYQNHLDRMMVGTTKSLMEFDYTKQQVYHTEFMDMNNKPADLSRSEGILELNDYLWLATGNGVLKCSYTEGICQRFKIEEIHSPQPYFDNYFYKIIKDTYNDTLWLNSAYGLKYLNMSDNTIHQIDSPIGFHEMGKQYKQHKMWGMFLDNHHRLWFAARTAGGVLCYEIDKDKWTEYKQPIVEPNQDPAYGNRINCIAYVNDSLILFANELGIGKVDLEHHNLKLLSSYDIEKGGWVRKLKLDQNGILWGTGENAIIRTKKPLIPESIKLRPPQILNVLANNQKTQFEKWNLDTITSDIKNFKIELGVINPIDTNTISYKWKINNQPWSKSGRNRIIDLKHIKYGHNKVNFMASYDGKDWIKGLEFDTYKLKPFYLRIKFLSFFSLGLLMLSGMIIWLVKRNKRIKLERKRSHQRFLAQMEMRSLRSQMNPHFIFNSLNSISSFIYKNENESAADYLARFARLMRSVLRNSEEKLIPLSEEISVARLYLELEKLRFDDKFEFFIYVDEMVDLDKLFIPPLLLQPYLENAVWHGILHKGKGGKLQINISMDEGNLLIDITDNGIGRKASQKNKKQIQKKKSYGLNITKNRLELINLVYETHAKTRVVDLYDNIGQPIGTKVIIKMPILNYDNYESSNH